MNTSLQNSLQCVLGVAAGCAAATLIAAPSLAASSNPTPAAATVSTFATGLNNPRGLKFGPDGYLYVAEGGIGGSTSTVGECGQVVAPVGPYTGSTTGARISKISPSGGRETVVDDLPSSQTSKANGGSVSGVADVAFVGKQLYALIGGAGCSHGVRYSSNGVLKINADGTHQEIANLSAFYQRFPVQHPNPPDFEPDGVPYSMVASNGALFVVEPNHGEVDRVDPSGKTTRLIDVSAAQGHVVPTSIAQQDCNFYVGNLGVFPIVQGSSKVFQVNTKGEIRVIASGFEAVVGVAFDDLGRLYVLELTAGAPFPTPGMGQIVRVTETGAQQTVAKGLSFPTAMTFGPDKNLYVSNNGIGAPGSGTVVKIEIPDL